LVELRLPLGRESLPLFLGHIRELLHSRGYGLIENHVERVAAHQFSRTGPAVEDRANLLLQGGIGRTVQDDSECLGELARDRDISPCEIVYRLG
jgi:hypothetical protein